MTTNEKIGTGHLERAAYVYVRQSNMYQVRLHVESRRRQFDLAARARELGFRTVEIIDEDLGRSGSGSEVRPGFGKLLAVICEGKVGAVLALEASRLARNNRDWHHLIDLCAMTDTLVIDHDGVYDPGALNDRLLLGLKGTMSEFELSLLRQRAQEALRQKIERGEVLCRVAIGYARTGNNQIEIAPDRQVQQAVRSVFQKFGELGSARQVQLWFRQHDIPFPTWSVESGGREIVWRLPVYNRIVSVLKNPVYAGAFVHGRRQRRTVVVGGRARKTDGHDVPQEQWMVLIKDHHPSYISWDAYMRNQEQLERNAGMRGRMHGGAPKRGPALLTGLLRCGACGRKIHVAYGGIRGRVHRYNCRGAHLNHGADWCISFGGLKVDEAVVRQVLAALEPVAIQASLDVWEGLQKDQDAQRQALALAVQKAQYEADRLHRQYDAVDPDNRLVAGELEARWNVALKRVAEHEERLRALDARRPTLTPEEGEALRRLGQDLRGVWDHPAASMATKKRILRTVLHEIVANVTETPPGVLLKLHWAGGVHTEIIVPRNGLGKHRRCTDHSVVELIRELAKVSEDAAIASLLNRLGYPTGTGLTWNEPRVRSMRRNYEIASFDQAGERSWLTLQQAARDLGVSPPVLRRLIKRGVLPAKQVVRSAPWVIEREDLSRPGVQATVQAIRDGHRAPRTLGVDTQTPVFEAFKEM